MKRENTSIFCYMICLQALPGSKGTYQLPVTQRDRQTKREGRAESTNSTTGYNVSAEKILEEYQANALFIECDSFKHA